MQTELLEESKMNVAENYEEDYRLSRGIFYLQDSYTGTRIMDTRARKTRRLLSELHQGKRTEPRRFSSGAKTKKLISSSYFTVQYLLVLLALTASLLILPLILPQLPPPPLMFLMVPIGILVLLLMLAFASPSVRDITYSSM